MLNIIVTVFKTGNNVYSVYEISSYALYAVLFFITSVFFSKPMKILQVCLLFSISIYMAFNSSDFPSFIILFVCISLCYVYGFFKKHTKLKMLASIVIIFFLFFLLPSNHYNFLSTLSWTALFFTFVLMVWYIFSDSLDKAKNESTHERLLEELKRSLVINERLIILTKEMAEKIEGKVKNG